MGILLNKFTDLSELTKAEVNTLIQIDNNPELLINLNLTDLAVKLLTSNTAIIRLSKKLGYSGFSEFKFDIKQSSYPENINSFDLLEKFQRFFNNLLSNDTSRSLNIFAEQIYQSKTIYIAGVGSSKTLAEYFAHRLSQVDKPAVYVYDDSLLDLLPNIINRQTLVIYISSSGETLRIVNSAKKVGQIGADVLSITNVRASSLASLSKCNIATQVESTHYHNYDISARTFQMAIVDLVLESYENYLKE